MDPVCENMREKLLAGEIDGEAAMHLAACRECSELERMLRACAESAPPLDSFLPPPETDMIILSAARRHAAGGTLGRRSAQTARILHLAYAAAAAFAVVAVAYLIAAIHGSGTRQGSRTSDLPRLSGIHAKAISPIWSDIDMGGELDSLNAEIELNASLISNGHAAQIEQENLDDESFNIEIPDLLI